jgi:hypothetical protein
VFETVAPSFEWEAAPASPSLDAFPMNSPVVQPHHRRVIARLAARIAGTARTPAAIKSIDISGHTDSRGTPAFNQSLGMQRATAIRAALAQAVDRLRPGLSKSLRFTLVSRGETMPVASNATPAGQIRNRRVVVWLNPPARDLGPVLRESPGKVKQPAPVQAPPPPAVPPLIYSESTVRDETHYVRIAHGGEAPAIAMTGIFVPQGYRLQNEVDIVLYLHGHHRENPWPPDLSIDLYWHSVRYPYFAFREGVNSSKKNIILVAPTLGPYSQAGRLAKDGGLSWYLDQVLAALKAHGPFRQMAAPPTLGNLVLACHSGGGARMREIVGFRQQYVDKIREVWGFDCFYHDEDVPFWANWAKKNPSSRLFIHYGNGGTARRSERLRATVNDWGNVAVSGPATLDHNHVPITYWRARLASASVFSTRP